MVIPAMLFELMNLELLHTNWRNTGATDWELSFLMPAMAYMPVGFETNSGHELAGIRNDL